MFVLGLQFERTTMNDLSANTANSPIARATRVNAFVRAVPAASEADQP